jgi:hypothetical protein
MTARRILAAAWFVVNSLGRLKVTGLSTDQQLLCVTCSNLESDCGNRMEHRRSRCKQPNVSINFVDTSKRHLLFTTPITKEVAGGAAICQSTASLAEFQEHHAQHEQITLHSMSCDVHYSHTSRITAWTALTGSEVERALPLWPPLWRIFDTFRHQSAATSTML